MEKFLLSFIGIVSATYYWFNESGSIQYYTAIFVMTLCVLRAWGWKSSLFSLIGFACWHFTNFYSDSWIRFLLLPLIAGACVVYIFVRLPFLYPLKNTAHAQAASSVGGKFGDSAGESDAGE